jgi:hypothetical protein
VSNARFVTKIDLLTVLSDSTDREGPGVVILCNT